MTFDRPTADLLSDLIQLTWFLAEHWANGTESPDVVEGKFGDFMEPSFRAALELRNAGYLVPDIRFDHRGNG